MAVEQKKYYEAAGGRKTAKARVRIYPKNSAFQYTINGKNYDEYFKLPQHKLTVMEPLKALSLEEASILISIKVRGGGPTGQAEASRHALAKALVKYMPESKKALRISGFLTRDARIVERKKYGLKKARRAPQWQKR